MIDSKIVQGDMEYIAREFKKQEIFRNKTILITGCGGFLGFYITNFFVYLIKQGIDVKSLILLDNFVLGEPDWIKEIKDNDGKVAVYKFDISKDNISDIPLAKNADFVIHMASIASPTYYRKYPIETIDANVWGLRNLLEYYKEESLKSLVFFSTSEIYGDPSPEFIPTSEEYRGNVSCIGPRTCYDEAKRFGEALCYVYSTIYGMPLRIVRPFNNYGPGMNLDDKRVPADFAKAIVNGEDIVIHSDGTPTRTFCYVADAIVGYLKTLVHDKFDYFNIGIEEPEISIKKLAEIYQEEGKSLFGYKGKIKYKTPKDKNYLTHNPLRRCPDITKAKRILDFNPRIKVEEGVRRFLEYLKERTVQR